MRLWHYNLIPLLSKQRLLGQHQDCCAFRGLGWSRKNSTVDYVWSYSPLTLVDYHFRVIRELERRAVCIDPVWKDVRYRGKRCEPYSVSETLQMIVGERYKEHDLKYLYSCVKNLRDKGEVISMETAIQRWG